MFPLGDGFGRKKIDLSGSKSTGKTRAQLLEDARREREKRAAEKKREQAALRLQVRFR